jgi:folate-dependent phosphoribosylglycinamide formyltransferase PurN
MADTSNPLRIVFLTSHGAPGLEAAIRSSARGAIYDVAAVISSEKSFAELSACEEAGIPVSLQPIRQIQNERKVSLHNLKARREYDEEIASIALAERADYIFLVGYNYIVSEPLLESFRGRIIALHDGDLTLRDDEGRRRYTGLHAVREALFAGEAETRSSAFFVNEDVGEGPLFLLSGPFAVSPIASDAHARGDAELLTSYATVHRRWMIEESWPRLISRGLEFLAAGTVNVVHDLVWIDGVPGPCRMGTAPTMCHQSDVLIDGRIPASCPLIRPNE